MNKIRILILDKALFLPFLLILLFSCENESQPSNQQSVPSVIADISGDVFYNYSAPGIVTKNQASGRLQILIGSTNTTAGNKFSLAITLTYVDNIEKKGEFNIIDSTDGYKKDFAMAAFITGSGQNEKTYMAYRGTLKIDTLYGNKLQGTFNFIAKDTKSSANIQAKNGKLIFN